MAGYIYNVCLCLSVTGCDWACLVIMFANSCNKFSNK